MIATPEKVSAERGGVLRPGVIAWLTAVLRSPLVRNGYALVMSAGITSVLGLVFWVIAARVHTPAEVGIGAALLSTMLTLGNIGQLNLGNLLNRFLPVAGPATARIILRSYAASVVAAALLSAGFILTVTHIAPELAYLAADPYLAASFVISAMLWTIFALQDSVLAGLRKAAWLPLENAIYAIAKIIVLVVLTQATLTGSAIFFAWNAPLPFLVAAVSIAMFWYFIPAIRASGDAGVPIGRKDVTRYFGWDYAGTLASMAAMGFAPILVLNVSGAKAVAEYHLAWTIAYSLYLIGRSMSISLLAEGSADSSRLRALAADALLHTLLLLAAALVVVIGGAYWIMALFGASYAEESSNLLRLLGLSCVPWSFVTIYLGVARTRGNMPAVAVIQGATLLLVVVLSPLLLKLMGVTGMGFAWLITHSVVALAITGHYLSHHGKERAIEWALALATSAARLARSSDRQTVPVSPEFASEPELRSLLRQSAAGAAADCRPLWALRSLSDVQTIFFSGGDAADEKPRGDGRKPLLVVKRASSAEGKAALRRYRDRITGLRSDDRLQGLPFQLPRILASLQTPERTYLVEPMLPGEEGRDVLARSKLREPAITAAIAAMADMHQRTGRLAEIDEAWLRRWIDEPAHALRALPLPLISAARQQSAIDRLVREQRAYWSRRATRLGLGHGDYSPGNILFALPGNQPESPAAGPSVSAVIDWEAASDDAPAGLDAVCLVITSRSHIRREEIGLVVCDLLRELRDSEAVTRCVAPALPEHEQYRNLPDATRATRALVVLCWLQHIHTCLRKSDRYGRNKLWLAWNVERVLRVLADRPSEETP
jgi:O-antigen/teichoic acid export membrane protein